MLSGAGPILRLGRGCVHALPAQCQEVGGVGVGGWGSGAGKDTQGLWLLELGEGLTGVPLSLQAVQKTRCKEWRPQCAVLGG